MALAFRSNNIKINSTAGTSCLVTAPSGIVDDDILIFMLDRAVVTGTVTLSGFTQLSLTTHDGGTLYVAWKRASSESGDYTASWTGAQISIPSSVPRQQARRSISAPLACIGKFCRDRRLTFGPTCTVQPKTVCKLPCSIAWSTAPSDHCQNFR